MDRRDVTLVFRYFLRKYSGYVPSVPGSPRFSRASSSVARPENCRPMRARWIIEGLPVNPCRIEAK